jgi:apolipoprotein N-acyltransferase
LFSLLLVAVAIFGWSRLLSFNPSSFLRVSVLQGNIPQLLKWDSRYQDEILRIYLNLTELASYDSPQLIVWPEAAYPGFFNREPQAEHIKALVRKIQIPLLVGSPHQEEKGFTNSAHLLDRAGEAAGRYDKIRLVPFGEYVPWKPIFGFLERYAYALGVSDFSAGKDFTVFRWEDSGPRFSVLICFEDIFPDLARKLVSRGADFLTVITNDAWFGRSSAPYQHLQGSIFRAIENGVSIVRAANTGVSGFINARGEVVERVRNQEGKDTFVMGGTTYPVALSKEETLYRRGGWLFPHACLMILTVYGMIRVVGAALRGRPHRGAPTFLVFIFLIFLSTGCIRLRGGAFFAKKSPEGETRVKEVSLDTDQVLRPDSRTPGKITV